MTNIFFYLLISLGINVLLFIPAFKFKTDKLTDLSYALSFIFLILVGLFSNPLSTINLWISIMVLLWAIRLGGFLFIRIRKMDKDKRFDGMRESFLRFLRFWLLQGLTVWVVLVPALLFLNNSYQGWLWLGSLIWGIGFLTESVADWQKYKFKQKLENKDSFINIGLWKYSRHPNYFGEILCWLGIYICVLPSLNLEQTIIALVSPLFIFVLLVFVSGIPLLEKYADQTWGEQSDYKIYKSKTSILIPWFSKKK